MGNGVITRAFISADRQTIVLELDDGDAGLVAWTTGYEEVEDLDVLPNGFSLLGG